MQVLEGDRRGVQTRELRRLRVVRRERQLDGGVVDRVSDGNVGVQRLRNHPRTISETNTKRRRKAGVQ
jgi:hypothetical protein